MEGIGILVWLIGIAVEVLSIVFSVKTEPCRHKKGYMYACACFNGFCLLCTIGIFSDMLFYDMPKDIILVTYGTIIIWGCYWFGYAIQRLASKRIYHQPWLGILVLDFRFAVLGLYANRTEFSGQHNCAWNKKGRK